MAVMSEHSFRERIAIVAIGLPGYSLSSQIFDYGLYPWAIWELGPWQGAALMTLLSFLICWATLLFYDWAKKDWLGIETVKELREYSGNNRLARILKWAMAKGDAVVLIILSAWTDPFITVAYMRHGAHQYTGMNVRDWQIFILSLAIGNGLWSATLFTGMSAAEYVWAAFTNTTQ